MRFFHRTILLRNENGDRTDYIAPKGSFSFEFDVERRDFPVTHSLRLIGEPDYFWKWRCEAGSPYGIAMQIDDALTTQDTYHEQFALCVDAMGEKYERNAWIKLKRDVFEPGKNFYFSVPAKTEGLSFEQNGEVAVELEIYRKKEGRHPNDLFDGPDAVKSIRIQEGTSGWALHGLQFDMPSDAVCLLVHIGIKGATGKILLGSPRLETEGSDNVIPPLARQQARETDFNYVADNFSRRDWLEFKCLIDGNCIFDGNKYSSIFRRPDYELETGVLTPGRHKVTLIFKNDFENAVGFVLQQLELLEYANHDFELIAAPEHIAENEPCHVLIKTSVEQVSILAEGKDYDFTGKGLHALTLPPSSEAVRTVTLESRTHSDSFTVKKVPAAGAKLYLSTGDSIFVPREIPDMERFLEWYLGNNVGNALCFRHSYRWGGGRAPNPEMWSRIVPLLRELGIAYSLMIDGRELPGCNINPSDSEIAGEGYLGRQSHENDGSLCYWGNNMWKSEPLPEPYADLLSRRVDAGGIHPHIRPKRNGDRAWWFFDPTDAQNLKEAAEAFVRNAADAKGASTRHSGPSTLFRYFFQAGYKFLISEQMYGPEEVVLSALRGASKAYDADGFGAHLATQWSSTPHDTPEHAERYFLSLATCYLQGVTQMNIEEGLYRMEKEYVDYDRFSNNCLRHLEAHRRFRTFMDENPRNGKMVVPMACIQGRYDPWMCFSRGNVWCREGDQWNFGDAEKSYDLLHVFYPRSLLDGIYRCPCSVEPQGWYTGTPYGPVDVMPFEGDWNSYRAVIFLGQHVYEEGDGVKMLEYVKNGGTLLLSRRHLSTSLLHNGAPEYHTDSALEELLGQDWTACEGLRKRQVGKGQVIFFADDCFPANDSICADYELQMRKIAEDVVNMESTSLWAKGNEDVNFAIYEQENGTRTAYFLNIRWWDRQDSQVTLLKNRHAETWSIPEGNIVKAF